MSVIETKELHKRYGAIEALAGLDLRVPRGSIFGFLGPNGAGKTTTLRILVGLLRPTAGRATLLGRDAWVDSTAIRARIGYLPGDVRLPGWMTGARFLAFCDQARGGGAAKEIGRLRDRFGLDLERRIRGYSRGMKQKLGLIQALMHRPELLILDEPGVSLDPLVQQTMYEELRAAAAEGRTVLFSSHTLSEVEQLCDRVAIIRAGRLIEDSTVDDLRLRAVRRVAFRLKTGDPTQTRYPEELGVRVERDGMVAATWTGAVDGLLSWLAAAGVADVTIGPPDLEDLFFTYYRDGKGAEAAIQPSGGPGKE
ncbi:MAG: ABC transporter ATP-binding protein [Phycisphaerae bacterium]